jgi:hypothetical protein
MRAAAVEVSCTSFYIDYEGCAEEIRAPIKDPEGELLFGCALSPGSTLLATRAVFARVGPFLEALVRLEDWDWLLRARLHYRIQVVPTPLVRVHLGSNRALAGHTTEAANLIRSRRALYGISLRNPLAAMKFHSTILLEKSAAAYRSGHMALAVAWGLSSLAVYPFRNRAFFERAISSVFSASPRRA